MRNVRKRLDDRNRTGYSSFRDRSENYTNSSGSYIRQNKHRNRGHITKQRFRSQSRLPDRTPKISLRFPSRDKNKCFSCRQFGHFSKECPEKDTFLSKWHHREKYIPKQKGCSHDYESDPEQE